MIATPAIDRLIRALPKIDRKIAAARVALTAWKYAVEHRPFRERILCQARLYAQPTNDYMAIDHEVMLPCYLLAHGCNF